MPTPDELDSKIPIPTLERALERYLAGDATPVEQASVEDWIAADPRNASVVTALREAHTSGDRQIGEGTNAAWAALQSRIAASSVRPIGDAKSLRSNKRSEIRRTTPIWLRAAAALLIAVPGAMLWRNQTSDRELVAPSGQRVSTTLPDGSRMTLVSGSRATWPRRFGSGAREVRLEGEAFFDVVHDTTQPFRVRVGDKIAEDVGTRFVVRAWPEFDGVEVAVEEGAVALSRDRAQPTLLSAGDRGRVTDDGQVRVTRDGAARAAWTRGEFVFDNTTLADALPALGRWYGVTLVAAPAMQDHRVTGRFNTLPLDPLLESLALALDARISRSGSVITLTPR